MITRHRSVAKPSDGSRLPRVDVLHGTGPQHRRFIPICPRDDCLQKIRSGFDYFHHDILLTIACGHMLWLSQNIVPGP